MWSLHMVTCILDPWRECSPLRRGRHAHLHCAHAVDSASACSSTVAAAFSRLSGGWPCLFRMRFTAVRSLARTFSGRAQRLRASPASTPPRSKRGPCAHAALGVGGECLLEFVDKAQIIHH